MKEIFPDNTADYYHVFSFKTKLDIEAKIWYRRTLESGYYSAAEAAYATGFPDSKYFSRFVKKEKGVTPAKIGGDSTYEEK